MLSSPACGRGGITSVMTERGFKAASENKTEGLFLFRLQARSNVFVLWLCLRVGLKPYAETQRFVPKFVGDPYFRIFSIRQSPRVRSCRGACFRSAGCSASSALESLLLQGLTLGSREHSLLQRTSAGAAHGSGRFDKLATLIPPSKTIECTDGTYQERCQGG